MATKEQFYTSIYNDCDHACKISDCSLIRYDVAPGEEIEIDWNGFQEWHDKWEGFTEEEIDEIKRAEKAIQDDDRFPWSLPDFYDPAPVSEYKLLVWGLTYQHCRAVYAVKHSTANDVENFHKLADLYDSENDEAIEDFIDSADNGDFRSLLHDHFRDNYPRKDELLEIKEGDVYYIEID